MPIEPEGGAVRGKEMGTTGPVVVVVSAASEGCCIGFEPLPSNVAAGGIWEIRPDPGELDRR